jgi:hypothetical protein
MRVFIDYLADYFEHREGPNKSKENSGQVRNRNRLRRLASLRLLSPDRYLAHGTQLYDAP